MGSSMAENHPVGFQWVIEARERGAKIIHVDPRFNRTSAMADIWVPLRAGSDILFLGGLINYVLQNNKEFREYVVHYTNAATILRDDFRDTEDLDGFFSGWDAEKGEYDAATWLYAGEDLEAASGIRKTAAGAEMAGAGGGSGLTRPQPPQRDETLTHPRCVFQLLRRHFSRYTPEMVEEICGSPKEKFLKVAETLLENSGRDRTSAFAYAVAWTQHTYGVQIISCCALLSQLTGNMGRPGGGIMALRGHAAIQGSTDVPTLYHSIHGYMNAPSAVRPHDTLRDYVAAETPPTGYWANGPKWMVSYLKSVYGDAATPENDFGYDWHPKILGDHSHI